MRVEKDFVEFCESLNANHVEFLVVGGFAVGHHGPPRFTQDFDVFANPSPENFRRLCAALQASGRDKDRADVKSLTARRPTTD